MEKRTLVLILCAALAVSLLTYALRAEHPRVNDSTTSIHSASSTPSDYIPVTVSFNDSKLGDLGSFKNASTGAVVSFRYAPVQAVNDGAQVYVDQKLVGGVSGVGASVLGFSPDNKYFAFRWRANIGAYRYDFEIGVIDLTAGKSIDIKPQVKSASYANGEHIAFWDTRPYIDSYVWRGNHVLDVTSYLLGTDYNDQSNTIAYYRVSPMETWSYDFVTGSSTLIDTKP